MTEPGTLTAAVKSKLLVVLARRAAIYRRLCWYRTFGSDGGPYAD